MAMTKAKATKCEAEYYGKCGGHLHQRDVVYHCRPRSKDLTRGHGPFDETAQVVLCDGHFKRICADYEGKLPELYGWDFADSLECLTGRLEYTGHNPKSCTHCGFYLQDMRTETGACSEFCISMTKKYGGSDWHCSCAEQLECSCASFQNNDLHWALLTYINGFEYEDYACDACCDHPSWRDSHEVYKAGLATKADIVAMANANPERILQKNTQGKTPMELIPEMIDSLEYTLNGEYLKCAESGWARSNIHTLLIIKKELMEVLDAYAN
jgi:hypothetical protein